MQEVRTREIVIFIPLVYLWLFSAALTLYGYRYSTGLLRTPPAIRHPLCDSAMEQWDGRNSTGFRAGSTRVCSNEYSHSTFILCGVLRIPIRCHTWPTGKYWTWRYAFKFLPGERWVQDSNRVQNLSNLLNCAPQKVPLPGKPRRGTTTFHHRIPMQS